MAIKGLKEALAKKQARQHPDNQDVDVNAKAAVPKSATPASKKPQKKASGRGR